MRLCFKWKIYLGLITSLTIMDNFLSCTLEHTHSHYFELRLSSLKLKFVRAHKHRFIFFNLTNAYFTIITLKFITLYLSGLIINTKLVCICYHIKLNHILKYSTQPQLKGRLTCDTEHGSFKSNINMFSALESS